VGGSEQITSDALRTLATNLDSVKKALEEAAAQVEEAEIGGAAFSHYGLDMAIAYPSAKAFAKRDAESKAAHIETIQDRLRSTAKVWDDAEEASTVSGPR
jgi:hypothetical protein